MYEKSMFIKKTALVRRAVFENYLYFCKKSLSFVVYLASNSWV